MDSNILHMPIFEQRQSWGKDKIKNSYAQLLLSNKTIWEEKVVFAIKYV